MLHDTNIMKPRKAYKFPTMVTKVLFATRVGAEDWQEQLITEDESKIEAASAWAKANGFDRLRVATIDLSEPPDFRKTIA